jgi:hypothetical protein
MADGAAFPLLPSDAVFGSGLTVDSAYQKKPTLETVRTKKSNARFKRFSPVATPQGPASLPTVIIPAMRGHGTAA